MACLDEQINWVYGTTEIQLIEERFFINSPGLDMSCISPASSLGWPTLRVLSGLGCSLWLGLVSCCESWEVKGGGPDFQALVAFEQNYFLNYWDSDLNREASLF